MNKKKQTYSIRGKLVSAACMLLVAIIMVVSSTYAWFTLSTAPEVTGIDTAIGANGALEMALNVGSEPQNGIIASTAPNTEKNLYWGNLVDLSDGYGLDQITLLPSQFVTTDGTFTNEGFLATPEYGADGRVNDVVENTVLGKYNGTSFIPSDELGVRGVGTVSGMTDRELAYRNSAASALTFMGLAKSGASASLNTNGAILANVAVKHGTSSGGETYTQDDIDAMIAICEDLLGTDTTDGVLENIEKAYLQYLLQLAAGAAGGDSDTVWQAVKSAIAVDGATTDSVLASLSGVSVPTELTAVFDKLDATKENVQDALTTLKALSGDSYTWDQFSGALTKLCNTSTITVNGWTVAEIKADQAGFAQVAMNGLTVTMGTGGGVYADVADHCGDYKASIALDISYNGLAFEDFPATMNTKTTVTPVYLDQVKVAVATLGAYTGASSTDQPLTEFYGYILDLAFRTNAANSNLLLQTTPVDRIYEDNTNTATQGGGSTMTFSTTSTSFTAAQMKALMKNIKIVFFTPGDTNTIICEARLDADNAQASTDGNGLTANIYLINADGTMITEQAEADIIALTQNVTHNVSVLVYLDGTTLENQHVAADAAASMTGKLNLQFSSSANLIPMEYADLHQKPASSN